MKTLMSIVSIVLSLVGLYYIATTWKDGLKLQRFKKKYYTIYRTGEDTNNEEGETRTVL